MKSREFKMYTIKVDGEGCERGSFDQFTPDSPKEWAANVIEAHTHSFSELDPLTRVNLVETWNHKVGRKWVMETNVITSWSLADFALQALVK